jgi:hypothetical protein
VELGQCSKEAIWRAPDKQRADERTAPANDPLELHLATLAAAFTGLAGLERRTRNRIDTSARNRE